ncbi:MAG: BPSS1780 family membrane protein [Methylophilaceae bacterium]
MRSKFKIGYNWATTSFSLLKKQPQKWALVALAYVLLFIVLPGFPGFPTLVKLAFILSWPISLALIIGLFREADYGGNATLSDIINNIKPQMSKLLTLGGLCLLYGVLVSMVTKGDAAALEVLSGTGVTPDIIFTRTLPLLAKLLLLLAPMLMATWFAPPLIAYGHYSVIRAIKTSLAGSLQYAISLGSAWLVVTFYIMLGMVAVSVLIGLLSLLIKSPAQVLVELIVFACLLLATAWTLAFQYISYRDIFDPVPSGGGEIAM